MKGFIVRFVIAVVISIVVWKMVVTPFARQPLTEPQSMIIVYVLNFPVAVAGEMFYPMRGLALVTDDGGSWCDFCDSMTRFQQQTRLAIPTYLFLLYLPKIIRFIARDRRLAFRAVCGLAIYAAGAMFFFGVVDSWDRIRALKWLLILACAATIAWSRIAPGLRGAALILVLLDSGWIIASIEARFAAPHHVSVIARYPVWLAVVLAAVATFLLLVWGFEQGAERLQILHPRVAHDADDGGSAA